MPWLGALHWKHVALIVSAAAVFSVRFFRDFDLSPVEQSLANRVQAGEAISHLRLFVDTLAFIVQRDWSYFTVYTVVGFFLISSALAVLYVALSRRFSADVALSSALVVLVVLPIPTTLLLMARMLSRIG